MFVHICILNIRFFFTLKVPQQGHDEEIFKSSPYNFCCYSCVAVSLHSRCCQTSNITAVAQFDSKLCKQIRFIKRLLADALETESSLSIRFCHNSVYAFIDGLIACIMCIDS